MEGKTGGDGQGRGRRGIENESNGRKARRCECFLKDNRDGNKIANEGEGKREF